MTGDTENSIVEALQQIRAIQDAHGRDLQVLHRAQVSYTSLIRELCDELAHLRTEMATDLAEVRSMVRAAAADRPPRMTSPPRPPSTPPGT